MNWRTNKLTLEFFISTDDEIEEYKQSLCKCYECGKQSNLECKDCEECVCEDCVVPYTQFNQVDYTLCKSCYYQRLDQLAAEF